MDRKKMKNDRKGKDDQRMAEERGGGGAEGTSGR
jgi:hypothetical protein